MFSPKISPKGDTENHGQFCKYELIKHRPYVDNMENTYNNLTENDDLIQLWRVFHAFVYNM